MRVLILGSGVIGTSIAWYATRAGMQVSVVDRQPAPGLETSYANAGEISPGYSAPWAGPGVPLKAIKWMLMKHGPLVVRPRADAAMWRWMLQALRNCTRLRYEVNKARMVRLAEYSRDCLQALRVQTGIEYDQRGLGTVQLFRTQHQLDAAALDVKVLREQGVAHELLDRAGVIRREPALAAVQHKFVGALRLPGDETGDCLMYTQALARRAVQAGAVFRQGVHVTRIVAEPDRVVRVETDAGPLAADAVVVATASYAPAMLRPLGVDLPIYPVKGYSITVPITDAAAAPVSTVMDETHKVAITRLGDRIRAGGTAELCGFDLALRPERRRTLAAIVADLFPNGGDVPAASFWCGLRPMTPDGPPIVGRVSAYRNLYVAAGHGTLGWTMAAGTGRVVADLLCGRKTEIPLDGLGLDRDRQPARTA